MVNKNTHSGPSFTFFNRLSRAIWSLAYVLLFQYSPKPFFKWRSLILRIFGAKVGKEVHIYPKVKIWAPWNIEFGDQCGVSNGAILYSQGKITIGRKTVISQGVHLCAGTHDYTLQGFPLVTKPIVIGDEVWIAAETFVHPGIIIDEGCVIGARSVVSKNMPPWTVCTGHPCKPIKQRIMQPN